jgi:hypothetical protein
MDLGNVVRLTIDLLLDSGSLEVLDGEYAGMGDEERAQYLIDQAERLAPRVAAMIDSLARNDLEPVTVWRKRLAAEQSGAR